MKQAVKWLIKAALQNSHWKRSKSWQNGSALIRIFSFRYFIASAEHRSYYWLSLWVCSVALLLFIRWTGWTLVIWLCYEDSILNNVLELLLLWLLYSERTIYSSLNMSLQLFNIVFHFTWFRTCFSSMGGITTRPSTSLAASPSLRRPVSSQTVTIWTKDGKPHNITQSVVDWRRTMWFCSNNGRNYV